MELELSGWIIVALCAIMVGISKTGIPGVSILVVPLMAIAIPARESVGVLLGILILADIFARGLSSAQCPVEPRTEAAAAYSCGDCRGVFVSTPDR
ncbi:MAG: hypothetical protein FVQ84_05855 [Planctomycetes bacterium]|nr:hypothetical protein [Planctomycetota bacterium]